MASGLPTLIIGVGGTGLRVLQRVKERLLETYYGEVPSQITLLEFDTALQSPADNFCGVQLNQELGIGAGGASMLQEMHLIQTTPAFTMNEAMAEARQAKERWDWLETDKLDRLLNPAQRVIIDGAGAFRPVGRTAFFLNYAEVKARLRDAMSQVMREQVEMSEEVLSGLQNADTARSKRNVFLVGSLAGGTGSGGFLDLAAMMRALKDTGPAFTNIQLIGIVALPRFFANIADDIGRRVPNTYAGLREIDRFLIAHSASTPYTFTGGDNQKVTTADTLFDLCYLVDIEDYNGQAPGGNQGSSSGSKPEFGALPAIADMIVAHTDRRLGLRLNANLINVTSNYSRPMDGQQSNQYAHYAKRPYSGLNSHTIIFPREDVARSLSLRFLLNFIDEYLIARDQRGNLIMPADPMRVDDVVTLLSTDNPSPQDRSRAELNSPEGDIDLGIFVRTLLQYQERRFDIAPDSVMRWLVEDANLRRDAVTKINTSIEQTTRTPADQNNMNSYIALVRSWQERWLGPLIEPNNQFGDRKGGEWEQTLGNLVTDQRASMEAYIQMLVLRILNQRQQEMIAGSETSLLRKNRVGYALGVLRGLKDAVRKFIRQAGQSFGENTVGNMVQLRRELEEQRAKVQNFRGPIMPVFNPNPGPVYQHKLRDLAEAERQRLLRNLTINMATQFGGDIAEEGRSQSVLDTAIKELEDWVKALDRVRELIAQERGRHETRRKEKYAIAVRSYVTDSARFPQADTVENGLYQRYQPLIARTLLGPDPSGAGGAAFVWEPRDGSSRYFDYQITTKNKLFRLNPRREPVMAGLLGKGSGVEAIAGEWMKGALRLMAEQVRMDKDARVAAYIPQFYADQAALRVKALDPNGRALTRLNGVQPNPRQEEHFLAVDYTSDDMKVSSFYGWFNQNWVAMNNIFVQAESNVACSFTTFYHGLELDQIRGFTEGEPAYRAMERVQGCLHLFPEERLASEYEAQVRSLSRADWRDVGKLHPDVVVGLRDRVKIRSFALAYIAGLVQDEATDMVSGTRELVLRVDDRTTQLSSSPTIQNYGTMRTNDKIAARLLNAFQTYTILGHAVDDDHTNPFNRIDFDVVNRAIGEWFNTTHGDVRGPAFAQLIQQWEKGGGTGPSLVPLFQSESKDPRFRDLGVVLALELYAWRDLR